MLSICGWGSWIRTNDAGVKVPCLNRLGYAPVPLAFKKNGSPDWTRTSDSLINSQVLYRLSYRGTLTGEYLSSRGVATQVLSAYECLTAVFGMGTGGTTQLSSPETFEMNQKRKERLSSLKIAQEKQHIGSWFKEKQTTY